MRAERDGMKLLCVVEYGVERAGLRGQNWPFLLGLTATSFTGLYLCPTRHSTTFLHWVSSSCLSPAGSYRTIW